jgi:putative colanic acid biosynthesis UDP-glucose lipid carrier transferase
METRGLLREYSGLLNLTARFLDVLSIFFGGLLAHLWRFGHLELSGSYRLALLLGMLTVAVVFPTFGLYKSWRGRGRWVHAQTIILAWGTVLGILVGIAYLTKSGDLISRKWTIAWGAFAVIGLLFIRFSVWGVLGYLRRHGRNFRCILIYGAGALGCDIRRRLQDASWIGLEVVGFLDDNATLHGKQVAGRKVFGGVEQLAEIVRDSHIDEVWIALPLRDEERVRQIVHELRHFCTTIRYVPDISAFRLLNHSVTEIAGLPVMNLSTTPMEGINRLLKAVEDRVLAILILMLISPLLVLIALGIKLSSPGPIVFKQMRHGWDGKPVKVYKFRSMVVHKEEGGQVTQASRTDARVTRFGAFLRRTSLDELPQFFNVLQGRMSIVGPRPHPLALNEQHKDLIDGYMKRHRVKPGITGWAQINGWRGETDTLEKMQKRVEYDLYYIEHWSLWLDLKIIFLTVFKGFVGKNAY